MGSHSLPCVHCLSPATVRLAIDKKNRPYTYCTACGTRAFHHHVSALRGIRLLAPTLVNMFRKFQLEGGEELGRVDAASESYLDGMRKAAGAA